MISLVLELRNSTFNKLVLNELVTKDDGKKYRATERGRRNMRGDRNFLGEQSQNRDSFLDDEV